MSLPPVADLPAGLPGGLVRPEILTLEIGSTITKANAFARAQGRFAHLGQGFAPTSVAEGDVGVGVAAALAALTSGMLSRAAAGTDVAAATDAVAGALADAETFVNSSAAGGLRMTVHGLTASMTARAAREASLGAGAIVTQVTAGRLRDDDLDDLLDARPNMVLLAGGVDHGEAEVVVDNARAIARVLAGGVDGRAVPVVYAGNIAARRSVRAAFDAAGIELLVADNVFPDVDILQVGPVRELVHELFGRHIVHAPGMAALARLSSAGIVPTPGAVLFAAERLAAAGGDVVVVDVGGATTDVHSVTDGNPEIQGRALDPEPRAKRTVEGDLGVFVNAANVAAAAGDPAWSDRLGDLAALPSRAAEVELTAWLCARAVETAVRRHAGTLAEVYTPAGRRQVVRGKDLTAVRWVVGTGGALTRVPDGRQRLAAVCRGLSRSGVPGEPAPLLPPPEATIILDDQYLLSALGTLARAYPEEAAATLSAWASSAGAPALDPEGAGR